MKKLLVILSLLGISISIGSSYGVQLSQVTTTEDQSTAIKFIRHTVTGITTPLPVPPDVPGFIGASYLTIGNVDQDQGGIKEIICTSGIGLDGNAYTASDGAVAIFTWDGSNIDNWTQSIINATFAFPNETVLRDMDSDSDLDIMVMDNFIAGWFTCGLAGIYYLENQGGDITSPSNWVKRTIYQGVINGTCPCTSTACSDGIESYHRAVFLDIDGDTLEDFVTAKVHMWKWQWTSQQYWWIEWFKKETDLQTYPNGYSGPYEIGNGGGFLFNMVDIDGDGDLDVVAPQFFIQNPGGLVVKGPGDENGDSLVWFENPGTGGNVFNPWNRCTIDNWYTSGNPMGKGMEVIASDIDNDSDEELIFSNHNHQEYKSGNRIWPSGVYLLEMAPDPTNTSQWSPVTIDRGDPNLDPNNPAAVAADVYAVDRPGGPYSQGSPGMVRAGTINDDAYPELVVPGDGKGALYYYQSEGVTDSTLKFKRALLYKDPACMPGDAQFDDIDNDGYMDVVAAIYDTSVSKNTASSSVFIFRQDRDVDGDGICNPGDTDLSCTGSDNCPNKPNGPILGTCFSWSTMQAGAICTSNADCEPNEVCMMAQEDAADTDGSGDVCDNCPNHPNYEDLGTCVKDIGVGVIVSYRVGSPKHFITCTTDDDCEATDGKCDTFQENCNSNSCGDVCECYADYAVDTFVDGDDLMVLKKDYGKDCSVIICKADGNGDHFVDGDDLSLLKKEYGRGDCPACQ